MITRLRTFLASWRRALLVFVGCLAYLTLFRVTARLLPQVVSSLGRTGLIIVVILAFLWLIAVLAFGLVGAYLVAGMLKATLAPALMRAFPETPLAERSDKAKEKHADSLMSVSTAVMSATSIGVFVFPLTTFLQVVVVNRTDLVAALTPLLHVGPSFLWQAFLFDILIFLPLMFALRFRKSAMDIYDELARPTPPAPAPGPNGATAATDACPVSADPPPPSGERR